MNSFDVRSYRPVLAFAACVALAACDGDSSDPPANPPVPTVTLSASPTTISAGQTSTLTWTSANATSCTASQGWSGAKPTSGAEAVGPLGVSTSFTLICSGNGGTSQPAVATVTVDAPVGSVTISGVISFERVPFRAITGQGLDPNAPVVSPARDVVVEVLNSTTFARIGSTVTTNELGAYSIVAPQNTSVLIQARAEMVKEGVAPTWNFRVLNNRQDDALYTLRGGAFNTGTTSSTRNLRALTGWTGTTYNDPDRAAAAFAILDTVYQARQLVLSAAPTTQFDPLDLFWSVDNRTLGAPFCPDEGNIGTSFYTPDGGTDNCGIVPAPLPGGIYILGAYASGAGDTDEFDQHVIAHEFGHYFEDQFSRSDSFGGPHGVGDRLDLRVAFGEGWGNAYSGMTLNDPVYRDSFQGVSADGGFNIETDSSLNEGWFSEASVGEIIWDMFDSAPPEAGDTVSLGFAPIFATMTGPQISTDALTSVFPFATAMRSANAGASAGIGTLLSGESISGSDAFGTGETNAGGNPAFLPVYETVNLNAGPVTVCVRPISDEDDDNNKLGDSKLLRLNHTGTAFAVVAQGAAGPFGTAAADPDIFLYRQGVQVGAARSFNPGTETLPAAPRVPATYVIEVIDFEPGVATLRCMTVSVTGS